MARDDTRPVAERQNPAVGGKLMNQPGKQPAPQVLEMLHVGVAHLSRQEALQIRHALTVVSAHLPQKPVAFAAAEAASWRSCRMTPARIKLSIWLRGQPAAWPTAM